MGEHEALRGMILAAGYGSRLAPITDHAPKPLLPVGGRPLLDRIVARFDAAGVRDLAVNTHHLGALVEEHLLARGDADRFVLFPEPEILGTGGALHGAAAFLRRSPFFLLHNGDVLCDVDLAALAEEHAAGGALATLLLVDWPAVNSVLLAPDGAVAAIGDRPAAAARDAGRRLTYAGVGAFSRELLDDIGPGPSSLIDPLLRALERDPGCLRGWAPASVAWNDLGTLPRWLAAQPAAAAAPVGPVRLQRLTGHGSDRRFWRLGVGDWSAVAMQSPGQDDEFARQAAFAEFLVAEDLGAPRTLSVHPAERTLLSEDLGPRRLYEAAREDPGGADTRAGYAAAVDHLLRLQAATERARTACPPAVDRCLDRAGLRWETDYFRERFLVGHLGRPAAAMAALDADFEALAATVAAQPRVLIHRDYQSQNLHWRDGRLGLVDFQGMRLGPLGYDAAALIFDPYVDLGAARRGELLDRFAAGATAAAGSPAAARTLVLTAGLQRLMQALGAFGFLGRVQGKREFLAHVPAGLLRLAEVWDRLADAGAPLPLPDLDALIRNLTAEA